MSTISSKRFSVQAADPEDTEGRASRRIIVSSNALKGTKLCAGDPVVLSAAENSLSHDQKRAYAVGILWPSLDLPSDTVEVAPSILLTARVTEGSQIQLFSLSVSQSQKLVKWLPSLQHSFEAVTVRLIEVDASGAPSPPSKKVKDDKGKRRDWLTLLARESLVDLKYLTPTQTIEVQYEGQTRRFIVSSATKNSSEETVTDLADKLNGLSVDALPAFCTVGWDTVVTIEDNTELIVPEKPPIENLGPHRSQEAYASVGGLEKQITQIRDLIEIPLTRPDLFRHFGLKPPRGLLLHGPPGTGKTHLARAIAASTNSSVLIVNGPELSSAYHGETEASLRRVFADARAKAPCIIVLDEVDAICPRREDGAGGEVEKRVVATLLTEMDGVEGDGDVKVVVVATTNRPNAIDPALRRPGRFDREIEIGIPDIEARISIFQVLLAKTPNTVTLGDLRSIASRAHGYVGADLAAVVREAGTIAIKRFLTSSTSVSQSAESIALTANDLNISLPSVRPSALRAHFLDMAPVRFSDIGGLSSTIARLRESVEWPLTHGEALARLGVRPPRGVLLCGPPGCSKTVLVRAIATESGVNFVAVRGPELLNKYVGESERAVREIFRKARAAAPSIIFFDEIDALATSRSAGTEGGSHEGVLMSLLNEMDGVEELVGVTVIGATNRPDVIDSALMRPGRLDRILYVGPPDHSGRVDILKIRMRKMSVDPSIDLNEIASLTEGCSGAEISALCQEAAFLTMQKDLDASFIPHEAFITAAKNVKKQITPEMLLKFQRWRNDHGVASL
ncbi:AAA ATPase [Heterobasidion irregulare TC 32-1]|uniref:AAA ATPase n=1 Tax=Heterobasidion irregulare (strain TC 32-1) TaxID=747525 RepID=W4KA64_HETIT|nr:AAA ATPase [Heterobasidion irregulare TC 32-1]ETW82240.1 AAA ATPase [Heterobasidion irregulare TC 32-1]